MKSFQKSLLILSLLLFSNLSHSAEKLKFSTLEWPPYLGVTLPNQGLGIEILKQAFKAEGYSDIDIHLFPWSRALSVVEKNEGYAGCLLAYYSEERTKKFIYSDAITSGPIKFAMRSDNIIKWDKLQDLSEQRIGVVQDYVNSPELDQLIASKKLFADTSINDANNLEKLAFKRIDMAVVDINVFTYLMKVHPSLKLHADKLKIIPKTLDDKKLYILFARSKEGARLAKIFNSGLKKIKPAEITKKYMEHL
jgi:polar amino acid transport system substrate-binding protein